MRDILTISEHQEIRVSSKRDVKKNTISYEDRELLFAVIHRDRQNKKRDIVSSSGRNKIKANSIVGTVSLKTGLTLEILPKFAKNNLDKESIKKHRKMLLQILRVSHEKNLISSSLQSSKVSADEMPLIHYIIELFSEELLHTLRTGIYSTYNKKVENSSHIRGNILVSKTIQNNSIDKSKVYTSYNKYSSNNFLMQVFRTLAKILLNDNNLSYRAKQTLHEVYLSLDGVDIIPLKVQDFKSITFNRLNDKFEILFRQAEFIFNHYMPFTSHINSTPFWAILFDMNYLFEKFCAYLFRKSDLEIEEQSITKCFEYHNLSVSAKPDFIVKGNSDAEIINVVDAKWKLFTNDKSLYGLDAQNFWQLFSYMNLLNHDKELRGYFIVPKNNDDFDDEIIFTPIKEGNKSITILSIDFSLSFEELIEKYRFKIIDDELKLEVGINQEKSFAINDLENDLVRFQENQRLNKKYIDSLTEDKFRIDFATFTDLISHISDKSFKHDKQLLKDFCKLSKTRIKKVFENMRKAQNTKIDIELLYEALEKTPGTAFYKKVSIENRKFKMQKNRLNATQMNQEYNKGDKDSEDIQIKPIERQEIITEESIDSFLIADKIENTEVESEEENEVIVSKEVTIEQMITFNSEDVAQYYSNDYDTIISLAHNKDLPDEYKIILFYREYDDGKTKNEVQTLLINKSSDDLRKLFDTSVHDLINVLETIFEKMSVRYNSWLRGFVYCNNNSALFKIKAIIAKYTDNLELIEKLSNETNENKIIFAILTNYNRNEKNEYVVNSAVLEEIFINSIDNDDCKIAIAILKRKELEYSLFDDILEHCKDKIDLSRLQNNEYFDTKITQYIEEHLHSIAKKQKNIYTETKVDINPSKFTLDDYQNMNDDKKMHFLENVDFNLIDTNFIEFIVKNESNIDRLEDFTYNKTLPLKYLVLTYTYHSESKEIKDNINKRDEKLYEMIGRNIFGLTIYINENFITLDKEITLGYAMSQGEKFYRVREKISELTNDLDVLNELSKHRDDKKVLENIVFKTKDNDYFKQLVRNKDTIYSREILARIAHYEEYYEVENNSCLIAKLARNFCLLEETKEYLFEQYKNDRIFLKALSENNSPWELRNKIESALYGSYSENTNDEPFNGISFK